MDSPIYKALQQEPPIPEEQKKADIQKLLLGLLGGVPSASTGVAKVVEQGVMLTRKEKVGKALDSLWDMHNHYWQAGDIDKAKYVADMIDKVMIKNGMAPKGVARPFKDLFRKP